MHGLTLRLTRTVLPRWVNSQPSSTPAVCGEEGPKGPHAPESTRFHNSVATVDVPRESVLENQGNAQPEYPLRGILAYSGEDVNNEC